MTDIQRWTREVAEDPGAHAFVRLARAYRRQGRRAAARNVVLRGLERNPEHLGGHALLAVIHVEEGDRQLAEDEWETVMRLDPDNFDASRGLGFLALERGELDVARRHLDNAARMRPDDPVVAEARQVRCSAAWRAAIGPRRRTGSAERTAAVPRSVTGRPGPGRRWGGGIPSISSTS
ncbi:MAG: tetratricopeptide repeat protein [Gemmatimonadetes bacterium]|nr:tetratricopeptide repeat protein [Gemmatimonadota bacterium]NIQ60070.1 tetratricopeptide repeat protein [Gemmatimonadota bacterium]NIU80278.1 tetratricopeptide repeat protein [Gammaproteobacteria bacterium]NIX48658.1 tetratricopeptide repeat protein [Gemmatimonadota bacterium]NIY13105.1 tetratricopeptide repeat protein [Gemmatimonadota bacterium]